MGPPVARRGWLEFVELVCWVSAADSDEAVLLPKFMYPAASRFPEVLDRAVLVHFPFSQDLSLFLCCTK